MHFEIGLDSQRHSQGRLNYESSTMRPNLTALWGIEAHAAEVYTLSVFLIIKAEIVIASSLCCLVSMSEEEGT